MHRPESTRKIQLRRPMWARAWCCSMPRATAQAKTKTTVVRIAVARLESMPETPTLARSAVAAAKKAERRAQRSQVISVGALRLERCLFQIDGPPVAALDAGADLGGGAAQLGLLVGSRRPRACRWSRRRRAYPRSSYAGCCGPSRGRSGSSRAAGGARWGSSRPSCRR